MAPVRYWLMRLARRATPQRVVDWMLDHAVGLRPGLDTAAPQQAVDLYVRTLRAQGRTIEGATVCVVGYGGSFGVGLCLLEAGARRVILQDPFAPYRRHHNDRLDPQRMQPYFIRREGRWVPRDDRVRLVREPLEVLAEREPASVDLIVSSSVLEHVADVETLAAACARLLRPDGLNVHFVDLRDHFFRYPFEMLCYSEPTWRRWLNASNNLNRLRVWDYERIFGRWFGQVRVEVLERDPEAFAATQARIRPEFLSGDPQRDAATRIRIEAALPETTGNAPHSAARAPGRLMEAGS